MDEHDDAVIDPGTHPRGMGRRYMLKSAAMLLAVVGMPKVSWAAEEAPRQGSLLKWARLRFKTVRAEFDWQVNPSGDLKVVQAVRQATRLNLDEQWYVADVGNLEQMCEFPFIFMHGQHAAILSDTERKNLGEYLKRGGFMFIDDCVLDVQSQPDLFYQSMLKELPAILPEARSEKLAANHEIFRVVYDLPGGLPHMQGREHGLTAYYHDDRMVAAITASDLHCGWVNVNWFRPQLERDATRMGVNLFVYAMTH